MAWFRRKATKPSPRVELREASTRDLDAILEMLRELVADKVPRRARSRYMKTMREEQRRMLLDPNAVWFVAERRVPPPAGTGGKPSTRLVGCARATVHPSHPLLAYLEKRDYGYVFGVFVREDERRSGVGRRLLSKCESWLRERGARWVFLHSTVAGIPFYEALGYEPSLEFGKRL